MASVLNMQLLNSRTLGWQHTCPLQRSLGSSKLQQCRLPSGYSVPVVHRRSLTAAHSYQPLIDLAVALDEPPAWTLDQIAGLVFGGLLVAFYFSSQIIDKAVAKAQRRQLGLCEECGGVYSAATCQKTNCPQKGKL